jgi:siroheme synthase
MGRESEMTPNYDILAFFTCDKNRYLGGKALSLLAQNEEELVQLTTDVANAMKADVVKLKTGDYLIIRV